MQCREHCGACCIAISISSPIPGLPAGKPAGVRCPHLTDDMRCALFNQPSRPAICSAFAPDAEFCGSDRNEAMLNIAAIERATKA